MQLVNNFLVLKSWDLEVLMSFLRILRVFLRIFEFPTQCTWSVGAGIPRWSTQRLIRANKQLQRSLLTYKRAERACTRSQSKLVGWGRVYLLMETVTQGQRAIRQPCQLEQQQVEGLQTLASYHVGFLGFRWTLANKDYWINNCELSIFYMNYIKVPSH